MGGGCLRLPLTHGLFFSPSNAFSALNTLASSVKSLLGSLHIWRLLAIFIEANQH